MIPEGLEHPFFLAGGLDEHNIRQALEQAGCYGVDVSGGVETGGVKDGQKIRRLVEIVRSLQR